MFFCTVRRTQLLHWLHMYVPARCRARCNDFVAQIMKAVYGAVCCLVVGMKKDDFIAVYTTGLYPCVWFMQNCSQRLRVQLRLIVVDIVGMVQLLPQSQVIFSLISLYIADGHLIIAFMSERFIGYGFLICALVICILCARHLKLKSCGCIYWWSLLLLLVSPTK